MKRNAALGELLEFGIRKSLKSLSAEGKILGGVVGGTGLTIAGLHAKDKYIDRPRRRKKAERHNNNMRRVWSDEKVSAKEKMLKKHLESKGHSFKDKKTGKSNAAWNRNTDYGYKIYSPKNKRAHPTAHLNKDGTMSVWDENMKEEARFGSLGELLDY